MVVKMTVQELREALAAYPPNMPVTVDGYEGGHTEYLDIRKLRLVPAGKDVTWEGELTVPSNKKHGKPVLNIGRGER